MSESGPPPSIKRLSFSHFYDGSGAGGRTYVKREWGKLSKRHLHDYLYSGAREEGESGTDGDKSLSILFLLVHKNVCTT